MTLVEIVNQIKPFVGVEFTTNANSKRMLLKIINNSNGKGMIFIGIDKTTKSPNTISKYLYFHEIEELINYLYTNNQITFKHVAKVVRAEKKGGCIIHIAINLITEFLKIGIADYETRIIKKIIHKY